MKYDVLEEIIHENNLSRERREKRSWKKKKRESKERFPLICEKTRVDGRETPSFICN